MSCSLNCLSGCLDIVFGIIDCLSVYPALLSGYPNCLSGRNAGGNSVVIDFVKLEILGCGILIFLGFL